MLLLSLTNLLQEARIFSKISSRVFAGMYCVYGVGSGGIGQRQRKTRCWQNSSSFVEVSGQGRLHEDRKLCRIDLQMNKTPESSIPIVPKDRKKVRFFIYVVATPRVGFGTFYCNNCVFFFGFWLLIYPLRYNKQCVKSYFHEEYGECSCCHATRLYHKRKVSSHGRRDIECQCHNWKSDSASSFGGHTYTIQTC